MAASGNTGHPPERDKEGTPATRVAVSPASAAGAPIRSQQPPETVLNHAASGVPSPPETIHETGVAGADEADEFIRAFERIAASSDQCLTAIRRKLNAPRRLVSYHDLESAIWILYQVPPAGITVPHIRHCLDLLTRRSEGGVELDRAASEASGIDYDRLVLLLRSRHTDADDRFAGPKVPRKAAAGTTTNLSAGESPQAPVGPIRSAPWQPDPESLSGDPRAHDRELIPESVGHQINRYREECRKTIEDLAEEMEISTRAVQRHIKDDCMPLARVLTGYERIFSKYLNKQIVIKKMS